MALLLIQHPVPDFDGWKRVFDADPVGRDRHGVRRHSVYRSADDPNYVVVGLEFSTREQAQSFLDNPALRQAWEQAGADRPQARILEEVEAVTY